MSNYIIVTDSSIDLSAQMAEELQLHVVPLSVLLDGKHYTNYLVFSTFYVFTDIPCPT